MVGTLETLSPSDRERLYRIAESAEDIQWPACFAGESGWRAANQAYQEHQRRLGAAEMRELLEAACLKPPLSRSQQRDLLLFAIDLFLHTGRIQAEIRRQEDRIEVDVARCPLMDRFMDPRWFGLTACGCFARRKGWYDALGAPVEEELVMCRKWGDPVCEFVLQVQTPAGVAGSTDTA
jgi:hypothetical protein